MDRRAQVDRQAPALFFALTFHGMLGGHVSRIGLLAVTTALTLMGCPSNPTPDGGAGGGASGGGEAGGGTASTGRCELDDLEGFVSGGAGALRLKRIEAASELIGGPNAHGRVGDYLFENEKIRVIVQGDGRVFGPQPFGGTILDADLKRAGPGRDQFGETGLLYNFGRTLKPERFEILRDGSDGRAAILAVTGLDEANDYLSIRSQLVASLGRAPLADPYVAVPLRITNYFVLNPNEQRLRFVSSLCNLSQTQTLELSVGDLTDPGYVLEFFNPRACTNGFGFGGLCFGLDRMSWYGYQGDGVAYAYAPYRVGRPNLPEGQNAVLTVAGITGSIVGADGLNGLFAWVQPSADVRPGELRLPPRGYGAFARDFWVGADLGELGSLIEQGRASSTSRVGTISGLVRSSGAPLPNARVVLNSGSTRHVFFTGADGRYSGVAPIGGYDVSAWAPARLPSASLRGALSADAVTTLDFTLVSPQPLTVTVREANGGPLPAKVTVLCTNGPCPAPQRQLVLYADTPKDPMPDSVREIAYVPATGTLTLPLPPGQYLVVVSRGPEYSVFPNTFPATPGVAVDLRTAPATVNAVLARVIDSTNWMSADFHVHAVNSPDSIIDNPTRALSFAADGLDVIVSTDHDVVTDFGPVIAQTGLSPFLATAIGEEVSPMEYGHYNVFPLTRDPADPITGGAIDWAGATGPTLSAAEMFAEARRKGARTVQINHARGSLGGFTALKVDTDTFATRIDPRVLRMAVQPGATGDDSKLLSADFNAFELLNNAEDSYDASGDIAHSKFNDWFVMLSRGLRIAGTGVSDTHYGRIGTGWRTWVKVDADTPMAFSANQLADRLNAQQATVGNGPFVTARAFRVDGSGAMTTVPVTIGGTVPNGAGDVAIELDVQVPEYLDVTRAELFWHRPEDDAACPLDASSPRARTTRVGCDGRSQNNWPAPNATQAITLAAGDLEVAVTEAGVSYRRYRKRVTFRVPRPTYDTWAVAMVYGSRSLAPLAYNPPGLMGGVTGAAPFAITNPIYVDADGNGFDKPPFNPARPKAGVRPFGPALPDAPVQSPDEILPRWRDAVHSH